MSKSSHPQTQEDKKLNYNHHTKEKMSKVMKGIGVIERISKIIPLHALLTIYK